VNRIPMLEPTNSQEAKDFVGIALDLSERFDTPVLLRATTRVCHSQSLVDTKERVEKQVPAYAKDPQKYVMLPAFARLRRLKVEERINALKEYADQCELNEIQWGDKKIGIIASGIAYQYAKEAVPYASFLKLGLTNPLPMKMIKDFVEKVDKLYVVEELSPFIEDQLKSWGIEVIGREIFSGIGELSVSQIKEKILGIKSENPISLNVNVPMRPPVLCPGCPHRGVFYTLKKLNLIVSGDIGCYTLGALEPLSAMDTTICMGASIGVALGMEKANPELSKKLVAVIGDSTFFHSGITPLIDVVYNQTNTTTIILDNRTTAMTGHQDNPGTGKTLQGSDTNMVDLEQLVKAIGIRRVAVVDPLDLEQFEQAVKAELMADEPSVIIAKRPCVLLPTTEDNKRTYYVSEKCIGCKQCINLSCPAIHVISNGKVEIDQTLCNGCGVCAQVCPVGAFTMEVK
ncbi:MAG TPA: 4Fe-4S binding protein, partial [Clostridia bacterium]|nr:4Fe-4S binding protein [Clostridia bacterium]